MIYLFAAYAYGHAVPFFEPLMKYVFAANTHGHAAPFFEPLKYAFLAAFMAAAHDAGAAAITLCGIDFGARKADQWMRSVLNAALGFQILAAATAALLAAGAATPLTVALVIAFPLAAGLAASAISKNNSGEGFFARLSAERLSVRKMASLYGEAASGITAVAAAGPPAIAFASTAALLAIFALVFSTLPQTGWDSLSYQMEIPRRYLLEGRLHFTPEIYFWGYPQLLNMIYSIFIMFRMETLCSTFHALFAPLTAVTLLAFPAAMIPAGRFGTTARTLAALLVCSHPQIAIMASYAFVDLGLAFYFTGAALFAMAGALVPAAIFLGGALSTKYTGLVMSAILFFTIVFFYRGDVRSRVRSAVLMCIIAYALFSPYMAKNFAFTGNIFYPFFKNFFQTEKVAYENLESYLEVLNRLGREKTLANLAAFPYTITMDSQFYGIRCYDGVMGFSFLAFIPFFFYGLYALRKNAGSGVPDAPDFASCALFIFSIYYVFVLRAQSTRYFLPILPLFFLVAAEGSRAALALAPAFDRRKGFLAALLAFAMAANASPAMVEFAKKEPLKYLAGQETAENFLYRNLDLYHCALHYNAIVANATGEVRLACLYEPRTYYFKGKYTWSDVFEPTPFENMDNLDKEGNLIDSFPHRSPEELKKFLASKKITHVLLNEKTKRFFLDYLEKPEKKAVFEKFIGDSCELVTKEKGYSLYSIKF